MANSGLGRLHYSARELYSPDDREPGDTECEHGSVIWLHTDPERGLCGPDNGCDQQSVALIDVPSVIGQKIALCPFHLARFVHAQPDVADRLLEAGQYDTADADVAFVTLDDVPPKLRNGRFERIGLDQRGEAHYQRVREDTSERVIIIVDGNLDTVNGPVARDADHHPLNGYIAYVANRRGWAALDGGER